VLASAALAVTLVFTVPSTNAYVQGDSVYECSGGGPTLDLAWIRLIRQDVTGGAPYVFDSLDVHGMEGALVTKDVEPGLGAHFYTQAVDTTGGAGCFSEGLYLPGYVTAVGDEGPEWRHPVSVRLYDIQGRLAQPPLASGVYRKVEIYADGRRRFTKVVVLR
jgi:hypothetical protein